MELLLFLYLRPQNNFTFFSFRKRRKQALQASPSSGIIYFFHCICVFIYEAHTFQTLMVFDMRSYQYLILIRHSYYIVYFKHYKYSHVYVFVCWCLTYVYTYSQDSILNDFGLFIPFCPLCLTLKLERMKWTKMNSKITWDSYFIQTSIYFFYSTERILIVFSACLCLEEERGMS